MRTLLSLAILLLAIQACKNQPEPKNISLPEPTHTSQNSLDWQGTYSGSLPCPDCAGILTRLTLNEDQTYRLETRKLGKLEAPVSSAGKFSWSPDGSTMILDASSGPRKFKAGENKITVLDDNGNVYTGIDAERFTMIRQSDIAERHWNLIATDGKEILTPDGFKQAHMILADAEKIVSGNGGCNSFHGSYQTGPGKSISFSSIASTKMACPALETESAFMKALSNAKFYSTSNDTLQLLSENKSILATFAAVYMK